MVDPRLFPALTLGHGDHIPRLILSPTFTILISLVTSSFYIYYYYSNSGLQIVAGISTLSSLSFVYFFLWKYLVCY
jgi:hypothetical protein